MDTTQPATLEGRDIIVVGASAGGVEALQRLVHNLPAAFRASVLVVLHVPATGASVLPSILSRAGPLPAAHARDGDAIQAGRIYVAPPDLHMVVSKGTLNLVREPKENGHRPAINPLFRTAAMAYGPRVVGVVLSGSLHDGTAGLALVKERGGITIVQDPEDALYRGMPESAILGDTPDYVLGVEAIAALLAGAGPSNPGHRGPDHDLEKTEMSETAMPAEQATSREAALRAP